MFLPEAEENYLFQLVTFCLKVEFVFCSRIFSTDEAVSFSKHFCCFREGIHSLLCICYLIYSVWEHKLLVSTMLVVFHCTLNSLSGKARVSVA